MSEDGAEDSVQHRDTAEQEEPGGEGAEGGEEETHHGGEGGERA